MPWQRYRGYTVSYSMLPWLFQPDTRTLPTLKPCYQASTIVVSCHIPHPATCLMTLNGGPNAFSPPSSQETSPVQYPSRIVVPTPMRAQASALASQLETSGTCSLAGSQMAATLAGLKPLASSSSPSSSYHLAATALTSRFTETTKESLRDGGKGIAETSKPTWSSDASTTFLKPNTAPSTRDTSPASKTQLMSCPEVFTHLLRASCPAYPSPQNFMASSLTLTLSSHLQALISTLHQPPCPSLAATSQKTNMPWSMLTLTVGGRSSPLAPLMSSQERHPWNMPLPPPSSEKRPCPAPYRKKLTPLPSPL